MRFLLSILTTVLLATAAAAGETPWQEVAPGVKLRLVSTGEIKADQTTLVGLEIDMPAASKTYWRVPGDTGLPTQLDFSASLGVSGHRIVWPYPTRQETADYLDYVYFGPTILPVEVTVNSGQPTAEISAMLGICSEICLPAQAHFSLPLTEAAPDRPNGLRIRQALAMAPIAWEGDPQAIGDARLSADGTMLEVAVSDPDIDPASLIAAVPDDDTLFGTPQKSPERDLVLIPILGRDAGAALDGSLVQLTFMTATGAFEVTRTVAGTGTD